jgi:hypothetical protein
MNDKKRIEALEDICRVMRAVPEKACSKILYSFVGHKAAS